MHSQTKQEMFEVLEKYHKNFVERKHENSPEKSYFSFTLVKFLDTL